MSSVPHGIEVGGSPTAPLFTDPRATANSYVDALASLTLIEGEYEGIEIVAVMPNQGYDNTDTLTDTIDVSYRILGRPGVFTVSVPYELNWNAIAFFQIGLQANAIELIYEGAASLQETPTQLLVQPPSSTAPQLIPQPGQPIPV